MGVELGTLWPPPINERKRAFLWQIYLILKLTSAVAQMNLT